MPRAQSFDVIIVGGGLIGWSTAYPLARAGVRVAVVDRADEGTATNVGAGIIAPGTSFKQPESDDTVSRAATACYPQLLAQLAVDGEPDHGYTVCGALFIAGNADEAARMPDALAKMKQRAAAGVGNLGDVRTIDEQEARERFPAIGSLPGYIWVPEAARVNGRALRDSIRRAAEKRGAVRIEGTASAEFAEGSAIAVRVGQERHTAETFVIAGGAWSPETGYAFDFDLPMHPQRGQIIHFDLPAAATGGWPIVVGFHSHYLLTFPHNRVVAGATREHESGYDVRLTAAGVYEVIGEALRVAPGLAPATIVDMRIGLRPYSDDHIPIVGRVPGTKNVFVTTGHGGAGLQFGPVSGNFIADLVRGVTPTHDLGLFDPARFV